ncbi:DinB family protein [Paenibacillus oenotherae]|uniref:DinB family protein n=1 Tax=Paenibacillus oenotherae TaxID=1435645 RepID=A0ABS7D691_9BACL|nr:DinB family protein [Paenibacillus oenotherae]MBW7475462.1 DinB family protein [Paenibacillus oenotherae]
MDKKRDELIQQLSELAQWYASLASIGQGWHRPIKEDKWCAAEIVAHLMKWDEYLLADVLPQVSAASGGSVQFPDHDNYNAASSAYARSGISPSALLQQAGETRGELVRRLGGMTEEQFFRPIAVNGYTNCPRTGSLYSLGYLLWEFISHDGHHREQIETFFARADAV